MSIRSITVQYIGDVLFLPKLERDVKLVVERDYGTAGPDKRFVMERTCKVEGDYWHDHGGDGYDTYEFVLSCGHSVEWLDDDDSPRYCPRCGARIEVDA